MGIGCLFGFFILKKIVLTLAMQNRVQRVILWGTSVDFYFSIEKLKNYKIKKKHDVLHENFIMYEKNQNKGYANDFLCFLFRFYSYS